MTKACVGQWAVHCYPQVWGPHGLETGIPRAAAGSPPLSRGMPMSCWSLSSPAHAAAQLSQAGCFWPSQGWLTPQSWAPWTKKLSLSRSSLRIKKMSFPPNSFFNKYDQTKNKSFLRILGGHKWPVKIQHQKKKTSQRHSTTFAVIVLWCFEKIQNKTFSQVHPEWSFFDIFFEKDFLGAKMPIFLIFGAKILIFQAGKS